MGFRILRKDPQSYAQALMQYHLHPEAKFHGGDFVDQGPTSCRHVTAIGFRFICKEADRLEERYFGVLEGEADIVYDPADGSQGVSADQLKNVAKGIKITEIARRTGLSTKHVSNILKARAKGGRVSQRNVLQAIKLIRLNSDTQIHLSTVPQ